MDTIENKNLSNKLNDNLPKEILNKLKLEAKMQISALKKINIWKNIALAASTLGVALAYAGFAGVYVNIFTGVLGVIIILLGTLSAVIFGLGLKNGKRNVEKILDVIDKEEAL